MIYIYIYIHSFILHLFQYGKVLLDKADFEHLRHVIAELHDSLDIGDESNDDTARNGTQLMEIYALEIQMYTAQKETRKLKVQYYQS